MADDFSADTLTTGLVPVGGSATGDLEVAGDHDWFNTTLQAGHYYIIDERGAPSAGGTLSDPLVTLRDSLGNPLTSNDDGGVGRDAQIAFHATADGTYFVDAGSFNDLSSGTYTVGIQDLGTNQMRFQTPATLAVSNFGNDTAGGGWVSQNLFPRAVGDVNGDGQADIIGFGADGVFESLGSTVGGGGSFQPATQVLSNFGQSSAGGGWTSQDQYPREVADVNGDGMADIVGFGAAGAFVSLATGGGNFGPATQTVNGFGQTIAGGGWTSQNTFTRLLGDVNGDGMADIVGFGALGTYVALATGGGNFGATQFVLPNFGQSAAGGGWTTFKTYPRAVADVNGDGKADIIGFGSIGVFVSLATGGGNFAAPISALSGFGQSTAGGGWTNQNTFTRQVADVNADGRADIVGFGASGTFYALGQADGTFGPVTTDIGLFGTTAAAGGWTSQDIYPRLLGDVTGDGRADIIGFGAAGAFVSPSHDFV